MLGFSYFKIYVLTTLQLVCINHGTLLNNIINVKMCATSKAKSRPAAVCLMTIVSRLQITNTLYNHALPTTNKITALYYTAVYNVCITLLYVCMYIACMQYSEFSCEIYILSKSCRDLSRGLVLSDKDKRVLFR